jgi:ABC-type amino acid transport substrate-binding protein
MRRFKGGSMLRTLALFTFALFAAGAVHAQALDGRLKKIAAAKAISVAYRADAVPFSFVNDKGQPDGFTIDLCKRVVNSIERQLNVAGLKVNWVPVTVQTRFEAVAKGRADMECGSSTMTLARMKESTSRASPSWRPPGCSPGPKPACARSPTCREKGSLWSPAPPTSAPSTSSSSAGK